MIVLYSAHTCCGRLFTANTPGDIPGHVQSLDEALTYSLAASQVMHVQAGGQDRGTGSMEEVTPHQRHHELLAQVCEHHREEKSVVEPVLGAELNERDKPIPVTAYWHGLHH